MYLLLNYNAINTSAASICQYQSISAMVTFSMESLFHRDDLLMLMDVINKGSLPYSSLNNTFKAVFSYGVFFSDFLSSFILAKNIFLNICNNNYKIMFLLFSFNHSLQPPTCKKCRSYSAIYQQMPISYSTDCMVFHCNILIVYKPFGMSDHPP